MVLSMDRWVGKVAVVTGASSGIGEAVAEQLVEKGLKVVGLARRKERLDELAKKLEGKKGKFQGIKTDLKKEEDILNAFKLIKEKIGPVHILINNAGATKGDTLSDGSTETWINTFKLNVIGLCIATREAIRDMKANNVDGHIVHMNSLLGHQVMNFPQLNVYPATKFAITALAETLRLELNGQKSKIKITSISPWMVETEIMPDFLKSEEIRKSGKILEAEQIADSIVYALSTPPHVQIQEVIIRPVLDL
uniref:Farnesol dehydrogenase-like protein n=1 Tax=Xylotrechus quadripes TaxID=554073 RepID=A0A4D6T017_9CUCU|nr:farnesol dehydrogenase-like protein [Xylotrechus quadripes]